MDNFYIDLPSNGSMEIYPSNTLANFTNQLVRPMELDGKYEVAMVEIIYPYPHTSVNPMQEYIQIFVGTELKPNDPFVTYLEKDGKKIYDRVTETKFLEAGVYQSVMQIHEHFRYMFHRNHMELKYNVTDNRFAVFGFEGNHYNVSKVSISSKLAEMLGFESGGKAPLELRENKYANHPPHFLGDLKPMFVYCNVIENQLIGNKSAPLLRVVCPDEHNSGNSTVSEKYIKPYYLKVNKSYIDAIQISIQTEEGLPYPFKTGTPLVLKLQFRRY